MAKKPYVIHEDGSVTFTEPVSDEVRQTAYSEAARQRANATHVNPEQVEEMEELARLSAEANTPRQHATEVPK